MAGRAVLQDPIVVLHRWTHGLHVAAAVALALGIASVLVFQVL